jgi:hypothetical protein
MDDHIAVASIGEMLLDCAVRSVRVAYIDPAVLLDQVIQLAANDFIQPGNRPGATNDDCRHRLLRVRISINDNRHATAARRAIRTLRPAQ